MPRTWQRLLSGLTLLSLVQTTVLAAATPLLPVQEEAPSRGSKPTTHSTLVPRPDGSVQLADHKGAPATPAPRPLRPGVDVTGTYQMDDGITTAAFVSTTMTDCPPASSRIQLSVSPTQIPLGETGTVTVTAISPDGAPVPGLTVTVDESWEGFVTTDDQGAAQLTLSPWHSGAYRVWAPNSETPIHEALLFSSSPGQSSVTVEVTDRCGEPFPADLSAIAPGLDGQYTQALGGLTGFVTTATSLSIEATGYGPDLGYQLYSDVTLAPEQMTTLKLSGVGVEPTIISANVDGEPVSGQAMLRPAAATGYGYYLPFNLGQPVILTPGTYAGSIADGRFYFIDSLALSGGEQSIAYRSTEFSAIEATASVDGTELAVENLTFRRGPFIYAMAPGWALSAGHFDLDWVLVRHPDGSTASYRRQPGLPVDLVAGEPASLHWEMALGAPSLQTNPTYQAWQSHQIDWLQTTADGWQLFDTAGAILSAMATSQGTGATRTAESWDLTKLSLWMPGDDLSPYSVEVTRSASSFAAAQSLTTTITPTQIRLNASTELVRAGEMSTVSLQLTQDGQPLANSQIVYWSPERPFDTLYAMTDEAGQLTLTINPAAGALSRYQFWYIGGAFIAETAVYAAPQGWGLVGVAATDRAGRPLPRMQFVGLAGFEGREEETGNHSKALLPSGLQPIRLLGLSKGHEGYLLTGQVNVPDGGEATLQLDGVATESLALTADRQSEHEITLWRVVPDGFGSTDLLGLVGDEYLGQPLRVTPGSYWVAPSFRNYVDRYRKLFPAQHVMSGDSVHADSAVATAAFNPYGVAATGEASSLTVFQIDSGGGTINAGSTGGGSTKVLLAPGSYTLTMAHLGFDSAERSSTFKFEGALPITVDGSSTINLPIGGALGAKLFTDQPRYERGETITLHADLLEQNGLRLTEVASYDLVTYTATDYPPTLTITGKKDVDPLPVQDGVAVWETDKKVKKDEYAFTLNQDLLGYFLLPANAGSFQIK